MASQNVLLLSEEVIASPGDTDPGCLRVNGDESDTGHCQGGAEAVVPGDELVERRPGVKSTGAN